MSDQGHNCPFLNRSDPRCSGNFSLDGLRRAFQHCLGDYQACPLYTELVMERRMKRVAVNREAKVESSHGAPIPVQVTVARRVQQRIAGAA